MIRLLTIDDLEIFRDIRNEALLAHPESFGSPDEEAGGERREASYCRWLNGHLLGAFVEDRLVGTTGFYIEQGLRSKHRGHIFFVYVQEAHRGKGIGDRLIKATLDHAKTCVDQVHLCVVLSANAAIKTYLRNGFEIYGTDPVVFRVNGNFL